MTPIKILIVDDDPQVHRILSKMLETKGYKIFSAEEGEKGLMQFKEERPDLLLLDLMMPNISGFELCQKIREIPSSPKPLILILSAKEAQMDRRRCLELGADDFVSKPFHISSLVRKIEHMLSKRVG